MIICLVVEPYSEKDEFVSWDDELPEILEKVSEVFGETVWNFGEIWETRGETQGGTLQNLGEKLS